jgi:hypothetical protein
MAYPFAFYAGHPLLQVSTQPGYVIIWGQLADLAVSAGDKPAWYVKQEITRMNNIPPCTFTLIHNVSTTLPHSLKFVFQYNLFCRWSATGCEFAIFAIILASGLVILIQWALLLLKPSNPSQLEASIVEILQKSNV